MSYYAINRLMDLLRVRIPGAIDGNLKVELFDAVDDFLAQTNVWRDEIEIPVTSGVTDYELTPTGLGAIIRLMHVEDANEFIVPATMPEIGTLRLVNEPSEAATYTATVALTSSDPVNSDGFPVIPDWIWDKYSTDIVDGVMARMFAQIAKPYSNERMAVFHYRRFEDAKSRARAEMGRQHTYGAQNWRFPQTFAVRRK